MKYFRKFDTATPGDLFSALSAEAGEGCRLPPFADIKDVMTTWIKQFGFPVVTAEVDYENGAVKFAQVKGNITTKNAMMSTSHI